MRDALGALGPVSGKEPELNNLTVAMSVVDAGDIVFLTSDGISDNFDPVVGKFAMPKKEQETTPGGVAPEDNGEKAAKGGDDKSNKVSTKREFETPTSKQNCECHHRRVKLTPLFCLP